VSDLIKIEDKDGIRVADSRQVHKLLEVKTPHRKWIIRKIEELGLVEGEDFQADKIVRPGTGRNGGGISEIKVYWLTQRAAEHIGMAESTEIGTKIRDAFIAARDELKARAHSEIYEKTKPNRLALTSQWAQHEIGHHFGRATVKEYEVAFGDKKVRKADLDDMGLVALSVFEGLETLKLEQSPAIKGITDIEYSLEETGRALEGAFAKLRIRGPNQAALS
jgi:phage anti-repressor protein